MQVLDLGHCLRGLLLFGKHDNHEIVAVDHYGSNEMYIEIEKPGGEIVRARIWFEIL